jgi:hypothetical protein
MSEAVSSDHDPNSRLPEAIKPEAIKPKAIKPKAIKTEGISVEQEDFTAQPSGAVAAGESLPGALREAIPLGFADWHPVEFPNAMSLAELSHPVPSVSESELSGLNPKDNQSDVRNLVDHLQQENSAFRAQINQLERDLAQAQVELQLEVTRFYCKESEAAAIPQSGSLMGLAPQSSVNHEELSSIHQQISQLSQELDSSQKMGHRQQILVETISEQLQSSQERIADLERDCAITQQRYNEQVQLVLQAENVCRDLRMRLHRQQRQALQFKAALEKSLEMGSGQGVAIAHSDFNSPSASDAATSFIPKVQPVQPWSQVAGGGAQGQANCRSDGTVLPNLLAKLLPSDPQFIAEMGMTAIQEVELPSIQAPLGVNEPDPSAEGVAADDLGSAVETLPASAEVITLEDVSQYMNLIFPRQAESSSPPLAVAPASQEAVFDLDPVLEAGDAHWINTPTVELRPIAKNVLPPLLHPPRPQKSAVPPISSVETPSQPHALNPSGDREDNLWADLAKLIEPDSTVEAGSTPDLADLAVGRSPTASNPFQLADSLAGDAMVENEGIRDKKTAKKNNKSDRPAPAKPLALDFFAYIEKKATHTPNTEALNSAPNPTLDSEPKSASLNLSQFEKKTASPKETLEATEPSLPTTSHTQLNFCPSPTLYPFRPAKKLKSMSAVDLPSFRHAAT